MNGLDLIQAERVKQLCLGYGPAHDAAHAHGEISRAALARLLAADYAGERIGLCECDLLVRLISPWPHAERLSRQSRVRLLTEAGALIVAELERLLPPDPATSPDDRVFSLVAKAIAVFARATGNVGRIADPCLRLKTIELLADFATHLGGQTAAELNQVRPAVHAAQSNHQPEKP